MDNLVLIFKAIAMFLLLTSFKLFSEELVVNVDVNAGETSETVIDTNIYSEAAFSFQLEKVRNNDAFPPGVNFIFSDKAQNFKILIGFLETPEFQQNIVMGTELWVNDKQVVNKSSAIEEFSKLSELTVYFNWADTTLKVTLNNQYNFELPFPPRVGRFSFGIQSAKGQIKVRLPNG